MTSLKIIRLIYCLLFISIIAIFTTGCFTITDEVGIKKNGAGTMTTTVDFSTAMSMLGMFMPDSVKEGLDTGLDEVVDRDLNAYTSINGITNVSITKPDQYIMRISYDFASIDALNKVLNQNKNAAGSILGGSTKYKRKGNKLERVTTVEFENGESPIAALLEGGDEQTAEFMKMMPPPTYKIVYSMPNNVKKATIKGMAAKTNKQTNTYEVEYNVFELLKGNQKLELKHCLKY